MQSKQRKTSSSLCKLSDAISGAFQQLYDRSFPVAVEEADTNVVVQEALNNNITIPEVPDWQPQAGGIAACKRKFAKKQYTEKVRRIRQDGLKPAGVSLK